MSRTVEVVTQSAERGGAAVAVGSYGFYQYSLDWLNHYSAAVLALCGICGAVIGVLGFIFNQYYRWEARNLEIRMKKERRSKPRE